jgi:hypothetical protein
MILLVAGLAAAGTPNLNGKIVKWDNGTYPDGKKTKTWIVYQLQTDGSVYSIARKKETKPQMQAGEAVQYERKKDNKITVINSKGKKNDYQIVGQSQAPAQ